MKITALTLYRKRADQFDLTEELVEENTLSSNTDVLQELEKWVIILQDAKVHQARYDAARRKRAG